MIIRYKIRDFTEKLRFPNSVIGKLLKNEGIKESEALWEKESYFSEGALLIYEGYCDKCNAIVFEMFEGELTILNDYEIVDNYLICKRCL